MLRAGVAHSLWSARASHRVCPDSGRFPLLPVFHPPPQFLQVSLKVHGEGPQALLLPKAVGRVPGSVPPLGLCQEPRAPWPLGPDVPCPPLLEAGVGWRGWGDS